MARLAGVAGSVNCRTRQRRLYDISYAETYIPWCFSRNAAIMDKNEEVPVPILDKLEKRALMADAHHLNPVVTVGQHGLTPAVHQEIELALKAHELIKIKLVHDRDTRSTMATSICETHQAALIQSLGQMLSIYRANPKKHSK